MSDNSLETSEPVIDVKETVEVEETTTEPEATEEVVDEEVKDDTTKKAEEVKEPTKFEKLEAEKQRAIEKMQKRIDQKTAIERAATEKMQQLESELAQFKANTPQVDDAPKEADFDNWEDYNEATVKHRAEKIVQEKMQEAKQAELQEAQRLQYEKGQKEFEAKELAFKATNPEYETNSKAFNEQVQYLAQRNTPQLQYANEMLLSSDVAPAMINELGANPELAEEWATMTPAQVVREVVYLEQRLSVKPEANVESLPAPIKSLKGKGKVTKSLNDMPVKDLMKWLD